MLRRRQDRCLDHIAMAKESRNPVAYPNHVYHMKHDHVMTTRTFYPVQLFTRLAFKPVADRFTAHPQQPQTRCRAYKAFKYVAIFAVAVLFSALVAFSRRALTDTDPSTQDLRILQFSPSYREYIPAAAVDYLLELRDHQDAAPLNPAAIRAPHPFLKDVSDTAITVLSQRSGWSVGYKDITSSHSSASIITDHLVAAAAASPSYSTPNRSAHPEYEALVAKVSAAELRSIVGNLSQNFATRYYKSPIARRTWFLAPVEC